MVEVHSSVMLNDGPLSDGMTKHVRSVSCPHTRPKMTIPYYRHKELMQMNHHTTKNTSESRYRYLHPAKSNSIVLLPIVSFSFPALLSFNLYTFLPFVPSYLIFSIYFFLIPFQVDSFALPYLPFIIVPIV